MRKSLTIFFASVAFLSFATPLVNGQTINEDSIRQVYQNTKNDSVKLEILFTVFDKIEASNPDSAYNLALYARELALELNDSLKIAAMSDNLAILSIYKGENYKGLQYELEALKYFEALGDDDGLAKVWNNLGESYYELDLFNEAYDYYNKALNKSQEIPDSLGIAVGTYNVGRVLRAMGQLEQAKDFITRAKKLSEAIDDKIGIPYALHDLGEIYLAEGKLNLALSTLNEAYEEGKKIKNMIDVYILIPEILNKMARVHREKSEFEKALQYHDEALTYYANMSNENGEAETYLGKARTLMDSRNLGEAKGLLERALKVATDLRNKGLLVQVYEELSKLNEIQNDFETSLEYYKKFKTLGDSVYSEKKSEQFAQLQVKYETQKKDIEIALLNQREQQQQTQLKNEEFLRNVLVVILAFTAVLLVTLYRSGARRKKINELLVVHQKEIEAQSKELEGLLEMKDKFFSIVSHDLRSPINALVGILDMVDEGHLTQEELVQVTKSLRMRLNNTRKLLDNLLDWAMLQMNEIEIKKESLDLRLMVEDNLTFFREVNDKEISFFNKVEKDELVLADKNMLDLIIRNLVSNSIKFTAERGVVEVFTEQKDDSLVVCISDSGVGMSPEQVEKVFNNSLIYTTPGTSNEKGTGLGLKLCKEFVDRMGGQIWVESEQGKGSVFKFTLKKA